MDCMVLPRPVAILIKWRCDGMDMISTEKKWKLLIVDDNPNEMNSLAIGLRLEGFEAEGVSGGAEALDAMSNKHYSVVLIDLMMPEMNGLQLARSIRNDHPDTVTIMMSAYHLSPVQLAKANTGVVGFVPKPFCFEELVYFIRQKLDAENAPPKAAQFTNRELSIPTEIPIVIAEIDPPRAVSASR
jgi:DNA-binding NtrC family response regulator